MEQKKNNINKYPKSKKNFQCIGPCYLPHTQAIHPTYLETITMDKPFCPTTEWIHGDKKLIIDICDNPTNNNNENNADTEINILLPYI